MANKANKNFLDVIVKHSYFTLAENLVKKNSAAEVKRILSKASEEFILMLFLSPSTTEILLQHNVDSTIFYRANKSFFRDQIKTPQIPVTFLVIGNPETGKTTLINSLRREAGCEVNEQEPERTAGIIPSNFKSKAYGEVTAYDFAGQREYYASHETVMQSILHKISPIVILNIKLTDCEEKMRAAVFYWISFIKNRLKSLSNKTYLIFVSSHADVATPDKPEIFKSILCELRKTDLFESVFELPDCTSMDCRESQSNGMKYLVSKLTMYSTALRRKGLISFKQII